MNISETLERICVFCRPNRYALKPYLINDGKKHPFAIICPGGGYSEVCSFAEGRPFAKELNKLGYHAFVVYYRVKDKARYPNPQQDLKRAVDEVFANAEKWNLDTDCWSIWGSSAGGHLAASYCAQKWGSPVPDAVVLVYPVITMGEHTHEGSRDNLLGKNPDDEMVKLLSVELNVDSDYPPAFIWYGTADDCVSPVNTEMFAEALGKAGVDCRVEKYEGIGHGAGLAKGTVAEGWFKNAVDFVADQSRKNNDE